MNPKSIHLNPSEWHVMEFLWAHGPATGRQAADHLTEKLGWSRSTTLTLLRRLEGKGAVASDAETGLKTFRPLVGREEAVLQEQGQPAPKRTECAATLSVAASIPDRYVPAPEQRMDLYRRIARIRSEHDADDLVDELIDRYGDPPRGVMNLIAIALLRARASAAGIRDIAQKGRTLRFRLAQFDFAVVSRVAGQYQKRMFVEPKSEEPAITLQLTAKEDPLQAAERFVKTYQGE